MTFEEFIAQQGYRNAPSGGIYNPVDMFPDEGHAKPNLSRGALEELYRQAVNPSAQSAWGTMGAPGNGPSSDLFTVNGVRYKRLGGDYSDPYLSEAGVQPQYDPTYGWIVQDDVINSALAKRNPDGWGEKIAGNLPIILGSLVLGGGLYSAFSGAGAGAGGAAAGAAEGAAGAAGSALPESYWSMLADSGALASDAAGAGAGTFGEAAGGFGGFGGGGGEFFFPGFEGGIPSTLSSSLPSFTQGAGAMSAADASSLLNLGYTPAQISAAGGSSALSSLGFMGGGGGAAAGGSALSSLGDLLKAPGVTQALSGGLRAVGGLLGSRAQAGAVGDANNTLWNMYQQNRADMTPYRMAGYNALGNMVNMTTPGYKFENTDPGAAYRLDSANRALEMRQRAGGKFYSGPGLQGVAELNQNLASQEFGNAFNRNASLAGIGQTANNATAQLGANTAGQVANNQVDIGNARASGYASGLGGVAGALDTYSNAQQFEKLLDAVLKRGV